MKQMKQISRILYWPIPNDNNSKLKSLTEVIENYERVKIMNRKEIVSHAWFVDWFGILMYS